LVKILIINTHNPVVITTGHLGQFCEHKGMSHVDKIFRKQLL